MDKDFLFACIDRFEKSSLNYLEVGEENLWIKLRKPADGLYVDQNPGIAEGSYVGQSPADAIRDGGSVIRNDGMTFVSEQGEHRNNADSDKRLFKFREIRSPIVGVFYAAAEPGGKPFVREGERIEKGGTLCMIEAMKMMNEVKAPVSGIVRRIGGTDGEMVECGQVLFEVESC